MEKDKNQFIYFRDEKGQTVTKRTPRPGQKETVRAPLIEGAKYIFANGQLEILEQPATVEPKPGQFYKARDGRKVQVWAINKGSKDKPVVGMIQTGSTWEARYWNLKGLVKLPYGPGNDIIAEWSQA